MRRKAFGTFAEDGEVSKPKRTIKLGREGGLTKDIVKRQSNH